MENKHTPEATCENCGRVYNASVKRHYCFHCDKYFHVCSSCAEADAKCRFCGIPLKRRTQPQFTPQTRRKSLQRAI